jgi:peptidoglycan/xylan/chitin deacetylase (PgdA/CDA1 family)
MSWLIWIIILAAAPWFFFYLLWNVRHRRSQVMTGSALVYHRVADGFDWSITRQSISQFERGIRFLHDRGYRSVGPDEPIDPAEGHDAKRLVITFDDGYEDVYSHAFPILGKFGFNACVFLVTGYVGREDDWDYHVGGKRKKHLSWEQIAEMAQAGFEFGSHTVNHPDLTRISKRFVRYELRRSKETLEQELGQRVNLLSYPFGRYNQDVEEEAQKAGYLKAYTICSRPDGKSGEFSKPRKGVYLLDSPLSMRIKLQPGPLAWVEETKGRIINRFAGWTVSVKGSPDYSELKDRILDPLNP